MKKIVCSIAAAAIVLSQTAAIVEAGYFADVYDESTGEWYLDNDGVIYKWIDRRGAKWGPYCRDEKGELYLPSFEIDRSAFGKSYDRILNPITLKSYVQPTVQKEGDSVKWDKISNASYYEIYQRLGNGEYKLLSTAKGTSCKLPALGKGKKYTFAVKPVAVIPGANYDKERDEAYPESFTVEGTMSEDITVEG